MPHDSGSAQDAAVTTTFADLGLEGPVLDAVKGLGYETPSPIQARTIPTLLSGRDVVGLAQTGTGKTAAFALPILARLDREQKKPQALVLAPTRELALQVCEAFERYAAKSPGVHVLPVYGGQAYGIQLSALRRGVHIVVGTPGRIMDHLDRGTLDLSELKYVVLDEADEMLRMGFAEDVETILGATPEEKQVALFSATMPNQIRRLSQQYLRDPEEVTVKGKTSTSSTITQRYLVVSYQQKLDALSRILEVENFEAVIVFTRTKNETETVAERLRARGFGAAAINGDVVQQQRERLVQQLKDGDLDVLVATDVAARGLDVERITHVVNYDIPVDTESYVHRVGRTGRAGRSGDAISFITPRERRLLGAIEKATRQPLTPMQLPTVGDVNATRLTRFDDSITAALGETERIDRFRDIIAHYVEHHDVPETDVAAALAVVAQGDTPLLLDEADEIQAAAFREERRKTKEGGPTSPGRRTSEGRISYRIEVGRKHKVEPRQIVGAIANEGGLGRDDFGAIKVNSTFSLVELPENLSPKVLDKLSRTRISGQLIELKPDKGTRVHQARKGGRDRRDGGDRGDYAPRRGSKGGFDKKDGRKPRKGRYSD
ncbi:DEAD/DEAH box helicase [Demequina zhanjiangensis]|uniref:ATP-dependent RNA helicase DeaD n=1 Tax=Demequina zhanjiangensis TaxID=3051659 RepID=A0ABT8G285_9MICO|nr:DEAD/DEAH box helicase [Demequina sp. SYSU T00b26]MDN4473240.1 DEAD/DEAH box helicase [Demequina sp. SYSU T00b26]